MDTSLCSYSFHHRLEAGLPMGCLAVDGAHLYEPSVEARALHRTRLLRWCAIAARLGARQIRIDTGGPAEMPADVFALIEAWAIQLDNFEGSSLVGDRGGVRLKPFGYFHTLADLDLNSTVDLENWIYRAHNVHGVGDEYDGAEQHFVAALQGRVPLLPSADLALNTMLICEGSYLASRLGREVSAAEVREQSVSIDPA